MRRFQKLQLLTFSALFIPLMLYQLKEGLTYSHVPLAKGTVQVRLTLGNETSPQQLLAQEAKWAEILKNMEKQLGVEKESSTSGKLQDANKSFNKDGFNKTKRNFDINKGKLNQPKVNFNQVNKKFNQTKKFFINKGKFNPNFKKKNGTKFVRKKWSPPPKPTTPRPHNPWENATSLELPDLKNCTEAENKWSNINGTETQLEWPCARWKKDVFGSKNWPHVFNASRGMSLYQADVDGFDDEVRDLVAEQMEVQQQRVNQLADTCEANPELAVKQHLNLVWATQNDPPVVYCPIYKVASTTWMAYFLRLAHINDDVKGLEHVKKTVQEKRRFMPRFGGGHRRVFQEYQPPKGAIDKQNTFRNAIKFIVVRHPFARFLSAYRDKIERPNPKPFQPYFQQLQKAIMLKYRPADSTLTNDTPTLSEFVDYVNDNAMNYKTAKQWVEHVVCWTPYWVQCGVCSYDYQVVIKLETMQDDEQFLFQIADMKELQNVHEWRNVKGKKSSSDVVPDYFKSLTKRQVQLLYKTYELDFQMFGYDIKDYLKYAKD